MMNAPYYRNLTEAAATGAPRLQHLLKLVTLALWSFAIGSSTLAAAVNPSPLSRVVLAALVLLAGLAHLQSALSVWRGRLEKRKMLSLLRGDRFLPWVKSMSSSESFLAQLEYEMERSRLTGEPCTLVMTRIAPLGVVHGGCAERDGPRAIAELARTLIRSRRRGDLLTYLDDGTFATLLVDCAREQSSQFLRRLPAELPLDTAQGRRRDVAPSIGAVEYDGVSLDPLDFLRRAGASHAAAERPPAPDFGARGPRSPLAIQSASHRTTE